MRLLHHEHQTLHVAGPILRLHPSKYHYQCHHRKDRSTISLNPKCQSHCRRHELSRKQLSSSWGLFGCSFGLLVEAELVRGLWILAIVPLLDPDRSHVVPVALPCSRLQGYYLKTVLPIKSQDFSNFQD